MCLTKMQNCDTRSISMYCILLSSLFLLTVCIFPHTSYYAISKYSWACSSGKVCLCWLPSLQFCVLLGHSTTGAAGRRFLHDATTSAKLPSFMREILAKMHTAELHSRLSLLFHHSLFTIRQVTFYASK